MRCVREKYFSDDIEEERVNPNSNFSKYYILNIISHYFLNVDISIVPVWISMNLLPVINKIHIEATLSLIFDIGSRFDFIKKIRNFYSSFHEMRTKIYCIGFSLTEIHLKKISVKNLISKFATHF